MVTVEEIFGAEPGIETARLRIRRLTLEDATDQFGFTSDPEVSRFLTWAAHRHLSETETVIRYFLALYAQRQVAPWAFIFKQTGTCIGTGGFNWWNPRHGRAEISYLLARPFWGQGLATEAVGAILKFGFERMELNRMEALVHPDNTASRRVMAKSGLQPEALLREAVRLKEGYQDHLLYAILRREWAAAQP